MFQTTRRLGFSTPYEGIRQKTLVHGARTLMAEFRLAKGSVLPRHTHPQEQTGYLISGRILLSIGEQTHETQAGDSWCIPGGTEHGVEVLAESVVLEVFSPVREELLPSEDK
jgi:quercetin dioxygenase-like cupin family protein